MPSPPRPRLSRRQWLNVLLALAMVLAVAVLAFRAAPSPGLEIERLGPLPGIDEVRVDVRGAVLTPGVVTARPGDRVADVIALAGGLSPGADIDAVNLARRVRDEERIDIPSVEDHAPPLLDLNTASQRDLETLPGIGPARARAVIEGRPYTSSDELVDRGIIPASVYEAIRDQVSTP